MASKVKVFLEMIKFEHTIFALPFAYMGAFLAVKYMPGSSHSVMPTAWQFIFITLAMIGARTAAMSLNRLIDRHIDALNPRTSGRAIPAGALGIVEVWLYTILSFAVLIFSALQLSPLAAKLLPIAVIALLGYSYTKRFTWLCHVALGIAIGIAPMGSWVAITNSLDLPAWLLGLAVAFWIAGFDIIYACQDFEFDKKNGVYSIPARFGIKKALYISSAFHVVAAVLLLVLGLQLNLGLIYFIGFVIAVAILYYEHTLVKPHDLSKLDMAFMNMNGYLSTLMFVFTLGELYLRR